MRVERRRSAVGAEGWTVTWKGRGWDRSFEDYLALVRAASDSPVDGTCSWCRRSSSTSPGSTSRSATTNIATPSAGSRSLGRRPAADREGLLADARRRSRSPTSAARILRWLREVPATNPRGGRAVPVELALKLMNARFDDAFQSEMIGRRRGGRYAGLLQPTLGPGGRGGVRRIRLSATATSGCSPPTAAHGAFAGTGNICSGRMALEYARAGCECVQLHTFFQLPLGEYPATAGSRTQRALHALLFDPADGLVACMLELEAAGRLERRGGELHFLDVPAAHAESAAT